MAARSTAPVETFVPKIKSMSRAISGLYLKTLIIFLEDKITRFVRRKNGKNEKIWVGDVVLTTSLKNSTASTATNDAVLDCVTVCTSAQTSKDIARYEIVGSTKLNTVQVLAAAICVVIPDQASANQWYESSWPAAPMLLRGPHLFTEKETDSKNAESFENTTNEKRKRHVKLNV